MGRANKWAPLFTVEKRARFLEVLGSGGNAIVAARAIGFPGNALYRMKKKDQALAADWAAAVAAAAGRLEGSACPFAEEGEVIRRTSGGRMQVAAARAGRWTARIEAAFLARLRRTGNVAASARSVGFDDSSAWERRRKWPAFARGWDQALEDASAALEFRLATLGNDVVPEEGDAEAGAADAAAQPAEKFDPEFALRFLKWRHEKQTGRGRRRHGPPEMTAEEAKRIILTRIEAIERHRRLNGG